MSDPTPPRDWDRELAEIDRAMAKMPAPAAAPAPAAGRPAASAVPPARPAGTRSGVALTWAATLLGAALAAALPLWPYRNDCGRHLLGYLAVVGVVVLLGLWALTASWRHRRGVAHGVALLVLLAGLVAAAVEILPRVGYAKVARAWTCPS